MNLIKPFLILELNLNTEAEEQEVLRQMKLPYLKTLGSYNAVVSRSYLFPLNSSHGAETDDLIELARQYKQESVLIVDANSQGSLYFIDSGHEIMIGTFKEVSLKQTIDELSAWTKIGDQYFSCIK